MSNLLARSARVERAGSEWCSVRSGAPGNIRITWCRDFMAAPPFGRCLHHRPIHRAGRAPEFDVLGSRLRAASGRALVTQHRTKRYAEALWHRPNDAPGSLPTDDLQPAAGGSSGFCRNAHARRAFPAGIVGNCGESAPIAPAPSPERAGMVPAGRPVGRAQAAARASRISRNLRVRRWGDMGFWMKPVLSGSSSRFRTSSWV